MHQSSISAVKLFAPNERLGDAEAVLLGLVSSDDAIGLGEVAALGIDQTVGVIEEYFWHLLDRSVFQRESLWQDMTAVAADWDGAPTTIASVICAIDMALWDLAARQLQVPCWMTAAGNVRSSLELCLECGEISPPAIDRARAGADQGINIFAFVIPQPDAHSFRLLRDARNELGTQALIVSRLLRPAENPQRAIAIGDELDRAVPYWIAGLLPDGRWRDLAVVRKELDSAVAAGHNTAGLRPFWGALRHGAAEILTPRLAFIGGPTGAIKLAHAAEIAGIRTAVAPATTIVSALAAAHVSFTAPETYPLCLTQHVLDAMIDLMPQAVDDGFVQLPAEPGLGIAPEWISELECVTTLGE